MSPMSSGGLNQREFNFLSFKYLNDYAYKRYRQIYRYNSRIYHSGLIDELSIEYNLEKFHHTD